MVSNQSDTIAAIATAMSNSGIGIIRVSGDKAVNIVDEVFRAKSGKKLTEMESHTVHYGNIWDKDKLIDEVIVILMKSPKSFTSEDTVEINCHGGILVMQKILEAVLHHGARAAEPGEFTKRAFLNGRIDLSQAESVIDVINAKNDFALKASLSQLKGNISEEIRRMRDGILHEIAFIESALDDSEHISLDGYPFRLKTTVLNLSEKIERLIERFENGKMLKDGIDTVIVGKPNAGKSSLMNVMAGEERAIVTDIEGTTRDVIEEQINLNGLILNVKDTAGIRETDNKIEQIGVEKARDYIEKADLCIYVVDSSRELDDNDFGIMALLKEKHTIVLLNKTDLSLKTSEDIIKSYINKKVIPVSTLTKSGIDDLECEIRDMFFQGTIDRNEELIVTNLRHKNALSEALDSLRLVISSIESGLPEDFYSIDLMNAYEDLGMIVGEAVDDDLINEIFSKFCIGK